VRNKSTITGLLSAIILLPLLASAGLQLVQHWIRYRSAFRLEEEKQVILTVPLCRVKWVEEEREILADGRMFDISSYYVENGSLIATGVFDDEETRVWEWLKDFNDNEQTNFIISVLLMGQGFIMLVCWPILHAWGGASRRYARFRNRPFPWPLLLRFYPPPRTLGANAF